jgi:hypothetical protein
MPHTIWKPIINYDNYSVSNTGTVRNNTTNRNLKFYVRNGYNSITLCKDNKKKTFNVHVLVAEHFLEKPSEGKYVVNHINENKLDNHLSNLEYLTYRDNTLHSRTDKRTTNTTEFNLDNFVEIPTYTNYMISKNGEIYSKHIKRLACTTVLPNGYRKLKLKSNDNKYKDMYVHVLVAITYLNYKPVSSQYVINHIDGDKGHNNLDNLEIVTQKENMRHSVQLNNHKIFRRAVYYIDEHGARIQYKSAKEASIQTGIDNSSILKSCKNNNKKAGGIKWRFTSNF